MTSRSGIDPAIAARIRQITVVLSALALLAAVIVGVVRLVLVEVGVDPIGELVGMSDPAAPWNHDDPDGSG